jgi:repressor LexA
MSFSQRLKEARLAKGYTQQEVADQIGVAKSTYSGYENGFREPDVPKIKKLINVLDCPSSFLLEDGKEQGNKKRPELTADERQLISSYQMLDDHGRKVVINLLQEEVSRILDQEKQLEIIEVIVYDFPAAAGIPLFVEDDSYERIGFPADQVPKGTDFGIRILGDSMEPTIKDRDIVFVRKTIELYNDKIGIFMLDSDAVCKRYTKDKQGIVLYSDNTNYPDVIVKDYQCFSIIGKVLNYK